MLGRVWTWHKCRTIKQLCELIMWQLSSESRELQKQTFARTRSWDCNQPTILDKSPWDSTSIFIFFCHFSVPSYSTSFSKISCSSLPPPPPAPHTLYKVETRKKFWIYASNIGVRGGVGPVRNGKHSRNAKVSQDRWLSKKDWGGKKKGNFEGFSSL